MNVPEKGESSASALLRQDLGAFKIAVDRRNSKNAMIFSNRFIIDSMTLAPKEEVSSLQFLGILLRLTAENLGAFEQVRRRDVPLPKDALEAFYGVLSKASASPSASVGEVVTAYYQLDKEFSRTLRDEIEGEAYDAPKNLGLNVVNHIRQVYAAHYAELTDPRCLLLATLTTELARISHVTEYSEQDLCYYIVLRAFQLDHEYSRWELERPPPFDKASTEEWVREVSGLVKTFSDGLLNLEREQMWTDSAQVVSKLVTHWREQWYRWGDLRQVLVPTPQPEPEDEPSRSPKEKLTEFKEARKPRK